MGLLTNIVTAGIIFGCGFGVGRCTYESPQQNSNYHERVSSLEHRASKVKEDGKKLLNDTFGNDYSNKGNKNNDGRLFENNFRQRDYNPGTNSNSPYLNQGGENE